MVQATKLYTGVIFKTDVFCVILEADWTGNRDYVEKHKRSPLNKHMQHYRTFEIRN